MSSPASLIRHLVAASEVALVLVLGAGATSKLIDPRPAFEVAEAVGGEPWTGLVIVSVGAFVEVGFVLAVLLRLIRGLRTVMLGFGTLAAFTTWLLFVGSSIGQRAQCGCLSILRRGTIAQAIEGNSVMMVILLVVVVIGTIASLRTVADT
jgi:hypothetical protein